MTSLPSALPPRKGFRGFQLAQLLSGSTRVDFDLRSLQRNNLFEIVGGVLWLGTLSIQTGKLNSNSIANMEFRSLSLSESWRWPLEATASIISFSTLALRKPDGRHS